ncbi:hypothetical protein [Cohnella endophytica]|nr:hypothetical protein [Cohnella endophytica]
MREVIGTASCSLDWSDYKLRKCSSVELQLGLVELLPRNLSFGEL